MTARVINSIRRIALVMLVVYWIVLFAGTHITLPPERTFGIHDKFLHFNGFGVLGFLLTIVMLASRGPGVRRMAIALAIVAGYGAVDEWTQPLVGRDCELYDWVADVLGGGVGILLGAAVVRLLRRGLKTTTPARSGSTAKP